MSEPGPEQITREGMRVKVPELNGTEIFVQRHEEFYRDEVHPNVGSLKPEAVDRAFNQTVGLFTQILESLPADQRNTLDVMVLASPTQYRSGGKRSMETAKVVLGGIREVFKRHHLSTKQILNDQPRLTTKGEPIPSKMIVEPKMFTESPEFVEWLKQNYGEGQTSRAFFTAFEQDEGKVREKRLEMKVEGPREMADRLANFLYALKLFSEKYHHANPGRRLILWTVSHYDTISPYIKTRVGGGRDGNLGVDYGAGFGINVKPDGTFSITINGIAYPLPSIK